MTQLNYDVEFLSWITVIGDNKLPIEISEDGSVWFYCDGDIKLTYQDLVDLKFRTDQYTYHRRQYLLEKDNR
jgi:hypothetical protein